MKQENGRAEGKRGLSHVPRIYFVMQLYLVLAGKGQRLPLQWPPAEKERKEGPSGASSEFFAGCLRLLGPRSKIMGKNEARSEECVYETKVSAVLCVVSDRWVVKRRRRGNT